MGESSFGGLLLPTGERVNVDIRRSSSGLARHSASSAFHLSFASTMGLLEGSAKLLILLANPVESALASVGEPHTAMSWLEGESERLLAGAESFRTSRIGRYVCHKRALALYT